MKAIMTLVLLSLGLSSCMSEQEKATYASFESVLESKSGHSYSRVRISSQQPGYVVFKNETTNTYEAYNMAKWNEATMTDWTSYSAVLGPGDIFLGVQKRVEHDTDSDGHSTTTTYYYYGGVYFSNDNGASKDLELLATLRDEAAEIYLSQRFKNEFSLSSARAGELAKIATRYNRLENRRALTQAEKNVFAMNALGVSMTQIERAMKKKAQGDEREYADMLDTAAQVNRTTPEQVGRFFDEMAGSL